MFIAKYEQDWLVDFEGKKILGSATHTVRLLGPNVTTICFDSAKLTIKKPRTPTPKNPNPAHNAPPEESN
jgi:hypothetical protein